MDERTITPEALHDLSDDELQRLANRTWYDGTDTKLNWECQAELMRRAKEREAKRFSCI